MAVPGSGEPPLLHHIQVLHLLLHLLHLLHLLLLYRHEVLVHPCTS